MVRTICKDMSTRVVTQNMSLIGRIICLSGISLCVAPLTAILLVDVTMVE